MFLDNDALLFQPRFIINGFRDFVVKYFSNVNHRYILDRNFIRITKKQFFVYVKLIDRYLNYKAKLLRCLCSLTSNHNHSGSFSYRYALKSHNK